MGCSGGKTARFNLRGTSVSVPALPLISGVTLALLKRQLTKYKSRSY